MQVVEISTENLKHEFKIILASKDITKKITSRIDEISKTINLPGFRPGKVPTNLIKKRYGQAIEGEVLEQMVNESCEKALNDKKVKPAMRPRVNVGEYKSGNDFEYTVEVESLPDIKPMDISKIELEKPVSDVNDKQVSEAIEKTAVNFAETIAIKEKRAAKNGDITLIDFKGSVDSQPLQGGEGNDYKLELGSNQFIPGFEEQIIGHKAGENFNITVSFPNDYHQKDIAGKEAVFEINLKEIHKKTSSKIDDELAKKAGFESLDKWKEVLKGNFQREVDHLSREHVKRDLLDVLADSHDFDIPKGLLETEFQNIWQHIENDKKQGRLSEEDKDKSDKDLEKEYKEIAKRRVRLGLLFAEIGSQNKVEVSDDEVYKFILQQASHNPEIAKNLIEFYKSNPDKISEIRGTLLEEKVVDFVIGKIKLNPKKVSFEDLANLEKPKKKKATKKAPAKKAATKKASSAKAKEDSSPKKSAEKKTKKTSTKKPSKTKAKS